MEEYIEDLFKIYNSSIDSYNAKILQRINSKYTIIDKAMLTTYLYIRILKKLKIEEKVSKNVLKNYLLKQIIYGETGNLALEIADKSREKVYKEVIEKLITDKFEYKNKIISKLKYNYTTIEHNEYSELIDFCESISEYYIVEKILRTGNTEAKQVLENKKEIFKNKTKEFKGKDTKLDNEKVYILEAIDKNRFDKTEYAGLLDIALNLKDVYRYSTFTTTIPENVLFHQYTIATTSIIFAEYLNNEFKENFDIALLMERTLFHDFGEYKGNEIVTQVKYYNEDTIKMFKEIEEIDEKELQSKVGDEIYNLIITAKDGKEGYVFDLLDKILGIAKIWIEVGYMHNYTYLKAICAIYQERFKRFLKLEKIDDIKNKEFLREFLRNSYIYIKEHTINKDKEILKQYFTEDDIKELNEEIKNITEKPECFLA